MVRNDVVAIYNLGSSDQGSSNVGVSNSVCEIYAVVLILPEIFYLVLVKLRVVQGQDLVCGVSG